MAEGDGKGGALVLTAPGAGQQLRSYIERIERLTEDAKALQGDIKDIYTEAKGNGFDPKIMRQVLRLRALDKDEADEQETLLDVYLRAIGMRPALTGGDD